jgi:hypothetical protein
VESIYLTGAALLHFMRVANPTVCTTGPSLDDGESLMRPLRLIAVTLEAHLEGLARLARRDGASDSSAANG